MQPPTPKITTTTTTMTTRGSAKTREQEWKIPSWVSSPHGRKRSRPTKRKGRASKSATVYPMDYFNPTKTSTVGSGVYVSPDMRPARQREQGQFSSTIYATHIWHRSRAVEKHIERPPSLLWELQETMALAQLNRDPKWARFPPNTSPTTITSPTTSSVVDHTTEGSQSPSNGAHYIPPNLMDVLSWSDGFGNKHAAPPSDYTTRQKEPRSSDATEDANNSSSYSQRALYNNQHQSHHQFPHRVSRIVRELRRRDQRHALAGVSPVLSLLPVRTFTLGHFLAAIERETKQRLVYFKMVATSDTTDRVYMGFTLDTNGRTFSCVCWDKVISPKLACVTRLRQSAPPGQEDIHQEVVWWGNAIISPGTKPSIRTYTCPCIV